jgi:uncharacterized protein (DUF885 family)
MNTFPMPTSAASRRPVRLAAVLLLVAGLAAGGARAAAPAAEFDRLVDDFIYGSLALSPVSATQAGYHRHAGVALDERLDDFSPAGLAANRRFLDGIERRLGALDTARLDAEQRADVEVIRNALGATRLELDEIQSYRHNPTVYVELVGNALYTPYLLQYAPAEARFGHIVARLRAVPALVAQARANLVDAPEIWNRVAREENEGTIGLIDTVLRKECPGGLRAAFDRAAGPAIASLRDLNGWLEHDLAKRTSDWRLGKALYAKKFRYVLATSDDPQQLLASAEAEMRRTREEMARLAAPQTVQEALAAVAADHATPDTYLDSARAALAEATAFVRAKDLLTLPSRSNLKVIETPPFMRGLYGVGGFNPAPPLEPALGAYYWVTPIPADWPKARIDSKLREYNASGMRHLTVHEAMPGHYVQGEYANDVEPRSRRLLRGLFGNGPYVEGWAVYVQHVMAEQGYRADTPGYRLTLLKQMLRVLANTILDIRLQTMGMSDEEAIALMTEGALQEREEADAKLQRAKLSSCQLPTYYAGVHGWLAVREREQARLGAQFDLKKFHERALGEGAVPLPVLAQLLAAHGR